MSNVIHSNSCDNNSYCRTAIRLMISLMAWASYQIHKIAGCACAGTAGNVFPCGQVQWKSSVSDPGMHHGMCVTHVPWCMSGSLARGGGENVLGIPSACALALLRIWQEAHVILLPLGELCCVYCECFVKNRLSYKGVNLWLGSWDNTSQ